MEINDITKTIIGLAIDVHKELGPGLLESVYKECMILELEKAGLKVETEVPVPIVYKGTTLKSVLKIDLLVENKVVVELKSVLDILPIFDSQVLTYLKLKKVEVGLLINFNVKMLKDGLKRYRV